MSTIDFKNLSQQLRAELSRVNNWRKIVRALSIVVYLFVFCWFVFVLFGGFLAERVGWENYSVITQYIFPVFIGFVVLNFAFSRSLVKFQEQENDIMRNIMSAMFPTVCFDFASQLDYKILSGSKLFNTSFSDPALGTTTYGYLEIPRGEQTFYVADIGVSYGLMNKLALNSLTGYFVMIYRYVLRPLFASRLESSGHNFRGMFGWCRLEKTFKGSILILPDHLEQKVGYLAQNIQGLKKRYNARFMHLEDPDFEKYFAVYADDEVAARMLLTPAMMRYITRLRETFGHDMMLSFNKDTFYYAAAMPDGFLCLRKQALDNEHLLEQIYNEINLSCHVADELKLN